MKTLMLIGLLVVCGSAQAGVTDVAEILRVAENTEELQGVPADATFVIMFSAKWCGPCKLDEPWIRASAARRGWAFVYVDSDEKKTRATRSKYEVQGLLTYLIYANGVLVDSITWQRYNTKEADSDRIERRFVQVDRKLAPVEPHEATTPNTAIVRVPREATESPTPDSAILRTKR